MLAAREFAWPLKQELVARNRRGSGYELKSKRVNIWGGFSTRWWTGGLGSASPGWPCPSWPAWPTYYLAGQQWAARLVPLFAARASGFASAATLELGKDVLPEDLAFEKVSINGDQTCGEHGFSLSTVFYYFRRQWWVYLPLVVMPVIVSPM